MMRVKARVYLLLLVGIMVGFMLSNLLQNLALSRYTSVKHDGRNHRTLDYKEYGRLGTIAFANLQEQTEETLEIQLGEYDEDKQGPKHNAGKPMPPSVATDRKSAGAPEAAKEPLKTEEDGLEKDLQDGIDEEENKLKDPNNGYRANWQGRTVQDFHVPQGPVNKLSDELATRKPLLIAIITSVQQLMAQTIAIHGTWAKNAKHVLYFTGDVQTMPHLPHGMVVIQLEGIDDNQASWEIKEFAVIKYLIKHYLEDVDWFLVIGDDVFVNPESLQKKLGEFNASFQVYMGHSIEEDSYKCSFGPGVVYSRGLLSRLESYLPQCQGELFSISQCIVQRGIRCTQAKEVSAHVRVSGNVHMRVLDIDNVYVCCHTCPLYM